MPLLASFGSTSVKGFQTSSSASLYSFSSFTFTRCNQTGRFGPTLTTCRNWYTTNYGSSASWVNEYLNMNVQGLQEWTVPSNGRYRILAAGACGSAYSSQALSGTGARLRADFQLNSGDVIVIAVGQNGVGQGGGGGGTFVVKKNSATSYTPLIIAGGGGSQDGRYGAEGSQFHDADPTSTSGKPGGRGGSVVYNGGTSGNGGFDGGGNGGAGGGYFTDGGSAPGSYGGYGFLRGGNAPTTNSLVGGAPDTDEGGFGGGGGTSDDQSAAGGGYSGGGGTSEDQHGGAGGSYVDSNATNRTNLSNNTNHGFVEISVV